jgi:hypothetical protein
MKLIPGFLAAALMLCPDPAGAAQLAQARLYCFSPRLYAALDDNAFFSLELSTLNVGNNGELGPYFYFFDPLTTHSAYLDVEDQLFFDHYSGGMDLNIPDLDANNDSHPDFFQVSQEFAAASSGTYAINSIGSGTVTAFWSRAAGSHLGTCALTFFNTVVGTMRFYPQFEILEYAGPLFYTPGSNTVTGTVNLARTGAPSETLQGAVVFVKSSDPYNQSTLQAGTWTNGAMDTLTFVSHVVRRRVPPWQTNYFGLFGFADGDLSTADPDYRDWELTIDDVNDSDHDGIPDFSDDPIATLPRRPQLTLTTAPTNLWLKISGDINHLHLVQQVTSLSSTNWQTIGSVMLTNDPQSISLPLPGGTRFWRVLAQ